MEFHPRKTRAHFLCSDFLFVLLYDSWSECAVDDTDDGYTGDNRDGDEQWYQYRTQEFCANAAFSLYGIKRGSFAVFGCTRYHFINSFFTYGGADNLLKMVGKTPNVYYDGYYGGNNEGNGDAAYYDATNAQCVAIDYNNGNGNQQQGQQGGGGSQDGSGYSSSLGCDAHGNYVMATFASDVCDGNYFLEVADDFTSYNRQHNNIGCHKVWSRHGLGSDYNIKFLLNNSWSCDLDLYPNGCPDPYGEKARYDFALKTVSRGGNARLAYTNMKFKRPLRVLSVIFLIAACGVTAFSYLVKNRERIKAKGGAARGYFRCLAEDFALGFKAMLISLRQSIKKAIKRRRSGRRKKSSSGNKKKRKKDRKDRKSRRSSRGGGEPDPDNMEDRFEDEEMASPRLM